MVDGDSPRHLGIAEWGMLITLSLVWGGSFFFNAIAVAEVTTLTVVFARVAGGAVLLWAFIYATGGRMPGDALTWSAFFGMGLLNNAIPFSLIVWGQSHAASGVAAILNATTPVFAVLVAHGFTTDERLTPMKLGGVLLGLAGVVVLIGVDALANLGVALFAQLAFVGASICYAFAGVFGRRFRALGVTPVQTAAGQVTASSLLMLPLVAIVDRPWTLPLPSASALGAIIGLAALCTAFAYILYFRILAVAGAVNLLLVTLLVPVSAIVLGTVFLDEHLAARHIAGMAIITLSLVAIDGRLPARIAGRVLKRAVG